MHFGDNKSMGELFNEQYGLNDMDINTLTSRLSSDNVGIYNFWNLGFRFASRPDYYNRITIFVSQMKGDGCFDAHSIENGKLVYDWTKDKRFDLFANTVESDVPSLSKEQQLKYKQQKAQYIAMAKQFVAEHAVDPKTDTEFIYEPNEKRALPRAYTTKQSEGLKALSDQIYGYYSHEKKILFQSTTFGALTMQMNTYWSSKKNQWLAPGGVKLQGRMEQYEENGKKYWYAMDSEGNITDEIVPDGDERASGIAYMQWKGQYEEGIILTLANIFTDWYQGDSETGKRDFLETLKKYYNHEDENLRRAYRNNLRQLIYDMFMMFFFGMLVTPALLNATKDYTKDIGNEDLASAIANNSLLNTVEILNSSFQDFNPLSSIFGRGVQWTPLAIQSAERTYENLVNMVTGDKDAFDTFVNFSAATRTQKPIWDYIKISTLGREIGDNGEDD